MKDGLIDGFGVAARDLDADVDDDARGLVAVGFDADFDGGGYFVETVS